jgi:hypothetical protein
MQVRQNAALMQVRKNALRAPSNRVTGSRCRCWSRRGQGGLSVSAHAPLRSPNTIQRDRPVRSARLSARHAQLRTKEPPTPRWPRTRRMVRRTRGRGADSPPMRRRVAGSGRPRAGSTSKCRRSAHHTSSRTVARRRRQSPTRVQPLQNQGRARCNSLDRNRRRNPWPALGRRVTQTQSVGRMNPPRLICSGGTAQVSPCGQRAANPHRLAFTKPLGATVSMGCCGESRDAWVAGRRGTDAVGKRSVLDDHLETSRALLQRPRCESSHTQ